MNSVKRLIPNLLTAGNLIGGIMAIIFTLTGKIELSPWCIFVSAIFDFLDGFVARLLKVQSELGKQLDSLADMVTFGVAPGMMVFVMINIWSNDSNNPLESLNNFNDLYPYLAFLIPIFALFRLAKFNLDTRQTSSFIGLPTPAMTLFFAVIPLLVFEGVGSDIYWKQSMMFILINPIFLIISTIVMSILMVVELPLFALKFNSFKWKGNEIRFIFLTISIGLFATLLFWSIPLIIILYLILSLINNTVKPKYEV